MFQHHQLLPLPPTSGVKGLWLPEAPERVLSAASGGETVAFFVEHAVPGVGRVHFGAVQLASAVRTFRFSQKRCARSG